jgi:hypothetical protein
LLSRHKPLFLSFSTDPAGTFDADALIVIFFNVPPALKNSANFLTNSELVGTLIVETLFGKYSPNGTTSGNLGIGFLLQFCLASAAVLYGPVPDLITSLCVGSLAPIKSSTLTFSFGSYSAHTTTFLPPSV